MDFAHFMRIDREDGSDLRHYVVHTRDPKFSVEFIPDVDAPDKMGQGVIKRLCVPNSCVGDYGKYSKWISSAQQFFRESHDVVADKAENRRFLR